MNVVLVTESSKFCLDVRLLKRHLKRSLIVLKINHLFNQICIKILQY